MLRSPTMRAKTLHQDAGERVFAVIFDTGEDPVAGLTRFAEEQDLTGAGFTAIGAFSEALLGYFDWEKKDYESIPVREQVEVLALVGDVAVEEDKRKKLHAHAVLGRRDGSACGGHLLWAKVRPTLEVILTETPGYLQRRHDPQTGLTLIRWDQKEEKRAPRRSRSPYSGRKQAPRRPPRRR